MPRLTNAEKKAIEARADAYTIEPYRDVSALLGDLRQANEEIDAWKQMFERAGGSRERLENRLKQAEEREKRAVELLERERTSVEPIHPSAFILDELLERGWGFWDLARKMGGDERVNYLALQIYFLTGPNEMNLRIGESVDGIAAAFGVSREFFLNLENAWLTAMGEKQNIACDTDAFLREAEGEQGEREGARPPMTAREKGER